ncbi:MAG: hypothetical protein HC800_06190 [Phormidesmis sp. RL_2_1]|nr:hypothetical protein [Phormidesmis sp. RL_2_1]
MATPDYPNVTLAFFYRGMKIEITTGLYQEQQIYSAWVTYANGSAVAVPRAHSREAAITQAKKWIQNQFNWPK